jgi:cobalt-zinc-cadmium efflux system membrane fusion protein
MKNLYLLIILASFSACRQIPAENDIAKVSASGDTVTITENSIIYNKLVIETVNPIIFRKRINTSGIVKAIPNNYAEIASPFPGRIVRCFICLGQKVSIGSPIFEISSPSFFEASSNYFKSRQELGIAEKNLMRQKDLLANGVGSQKEEDEAELHFELTKRDYENSIASLNVYHVKPEDLIPGQPLVIRSPIKGEVVENNIVIGQYLREDAESVAVVAELSKVWVVGQVKEKDINSIDKSDEVEITLTGLPDVSINGMVYHISEILDEETRSAEVFIECDNRDRKMKPGMFVTVSFSEPPDTEILIPSSAVLQMEESSFVFVSVGENKFLKRRIEIDGTENDHTILKSGINPSDKIVTKGGIFLLEAI